jgi:large subunit ribosomal protein L22
MPEFGYSIKGLDPDKSVLASGRDLNISFKEAVEVCKYIKGRKLDEAKKILEEVIEGKRAIPYKRFNKKVPHHKYDNTSGPARYPIKVSKHLLKILESLEANAEFKGLDTSKIKIIHCAAQKGMKIKKYIPRAFGRSSPYFKELVHIEVAGIEE